MPQITNINNLNIVWRGQSWCVVAPNGNVIARFKEKQDAIRFAEVTKDYAKNQSTAYADANFSTTSKSNFTGFDGELNNLEDDPLWSEDNVTFEKSKKMPLSGFRRLLKNKRHFAVGIGIFFALIVMIILLSQVARITSNVISAPNIFLASEIVPFLAIVALLVPILLLILYVFLLEILRPLFGIPLMIFGVLGLIIGILIGGYYFIVSLFSADYDTGEILITFTLWLWISFCLIYLGDKIKNEPDLDLMVLRLRLADIFRRQNKG